MIIYKITNIINKKIYIGQTIRSIEERWKKPTWLSTKKNSKMAITLAIIKYGEENFVIEKIDEAYNIDELNEKEIFYIKKYKSKCPNGYNIGNGGLNRNHSIETRRKIGESNKGKVGYYKGLKLSDEHRKNLSISHTGHNMKEETKIKLSTINKLKKIDPKVREAASIKNSKIYLLEKDNSLYVITNMKKFAMRNGHDKSNLSELASGKKATYKGFKLVENIGLLKQVDSIEEIVNKYTTIYENIIYQ